MTSFLVEPPLDQPYEGAPMRAAFLRFWKKGFTFTGRASRAEFWRAWAATTGIVVVLYLLSIIISTAGLAAVMHSGSYSSYATVTAVSGFFLMVAALYAVAVFIPSIAISIRRLHDINQPGAMYLLSFVPFLGGLILLYLLAQPGRPEGARFDLAPAGEFTASSTPSAPPSTLPAPVSSYGEIPAPPAREPAPSAFSGGAPVPPVPPPPASSGFSTPPVPAAPAGFAPVPAPLVPAPAALPFSAGVPVAPIPGIPSSSIAPAAAPTPAPAPDLDSTRMVPPAVGGGWVVELPDGRRIAVDGAVSFGRDPVSDRGGVLVPVDDPARSMSKTHARFDIENGVVVVTDLHSTNGTRVEAPGAAAVSVAPGLPTTVPAGATVLFGDYAVRMQHRG